MKAPETDRCACCGQPLPESDKNDPDALLRLLKTLGDRERRKSRELYKGRDGRWYVTYGGGEWPVRAVLALMARGEIKRVYNDLDDVYWAGRTIDTIATKDARNRGVIGRSDLVYVDAPA